MKISIIVFVWNMENTLSQSIDSILNSINTDEYEIILINGNSSDKSENICLEYQKNYKTVTYIKLNEYNENKVWNAGLRYSTGEYVYFLKGCTYLCENFINDAIEYLDKNNNINVFIRNYKVLLENNNIENFYHFFETAYVGPRLSMCIFRKKCIVDEFCEKTCQEPIFSGKIVFTNNYYFEKNNTNSFIDTSDYTKTPFLYEYNMSSNFDWIEYTKYNIEEYKKRINYEKL